MLSRKDWLLHFYVLTVMFNYVNFHNLILASWCSFYLCWCIF